MSQITHISKEELRTISDSIVNAYHKEWCRRYRHLHKEQIRANNREYYKRLSKYKSENVQKDVKDSLNSDNVQSTQSDILLNNSDNSDILNSKGGVHDINKEAFHSNSRDS